MSLACRATAFFAKGSSIAAQPHRLGGGGD